AAERGTRQAARCKRKSRQVQPPIHKVPVENPLSTIPPYLRIVVLWSMGLQLPRSNFFMKTLKTLLTGLTIVATSFGFAQTSKPASQEKQMPVAEATTVTPSLVEMIPLDSPKGQALLDAEKAVGESRGIISTRE